MATLYDLTADMEYLQRLLFDPDADAEEVEAALKITAEEIEEKAVGYAHVIRNLESDIEGLKTEETRLRDRRKQAENTIMRMKAALQTAMTATGKKKFDRGNFTFAVQKNGGAEPVILDVKPEDLPYELVNMKVEADKTAIAKYIKETGDLSYAHFGERGESLRIR